MGRARVRRLVVRAVAAADEVVVGVAAQPTPPRRPLVVEVEGEAGDSAG